VVDMSNYLKADERIAFGVASSDKRRIAQAAEAERLSMGAFIRTHIMKKVSGRGIEMENREFAGFQDPLCTVFAEYDFSADDKRFAVNALVEMASSQVDHLSEFPEGFDMAEMLASPPEGALVYYLASSASVGLSSDDFLEAMALPGESKEETIDRLSTPFEGRVVGTFPQE